MRALLQEGRFAMLVLALAAAPVHAQQFPDSLVGRRVQIVLAREPFPGGGKAPAQVLRGTVLTLSPDTLTLRLHPSTGVVAVAIPGIDRLEVSQGVRSRTEGAVRGAVSGGFWGGVEWWALDSALREPLFRHEWQAAAAGAGVGAVIGAILGATPVERWKKVRLH